MDGECMTRCVEVECKRQRRMLVKLRGGTAELRLNAQYRTKLIDWPKGISNSGRIIHIQLDRFGKYLL